MKIAVCCAMNQNRSMETHDLLMKQGYNIRSYGTSPQIKLPGLSISTPNVYSFDTTYEEIYKDLISQNEEAYRENGMLHLLERNMRVKPKPENFFETDENFDLVITCEERCFTAIFKHYLENVAVGDKSFYLVNFDIKDTPSDAVFGANDIFEFIKTLDGCDDNLDKIIEYALEKHYESKEEKLLYTIIHY
ncbi:RNA polymerase II subunit A C-terminal domain phosphatase SSU72 [Astathelohania contejeani]|uniref:RNA polymerase II subunit A C-terminal domain phosphatase SSU72 n=1 Tax=Astathelohania contejeani TaxID=164912 RepID=A0ABQ7HY00_9MICR|nr:RNA polymerase II subunit A C-terminal domain phosphatase SSU72 [Thelohania contejeani]